MHSHVQPKENRALVQAFRSNDLKQFRNLMKRKKLPPGSIINPRLSSSPSSPPTSSVVYYYPHINDFDENKQTCLHVACANGNLEIIKTLMEMGANANAEDNKLWTPLICALARGHLATTMALLVEGKGMVNVNQTNGSGSGPLHYLARHMSLSQEEETLWEEVFLMLIRQGAEVNATNVHGITPLHDACNSDCTYHVQALVRKGANVNATNKFGETPLHMAVKAGAFDTIGYLMYHGANPYTESVRGNCFEIAQLHPPAKAKSLQTFLRGLTGLPEIVLYHICSLLPFSDWFNLAQICRSVSRLLSSDLLWKTIYDKLPDLCTVRTKTGDFSYKQLVRDWYRSDWGEWLVKPPISRPEFIAKIMLVGDPGVGKSAFLARLMGVPLERVRMKFDQMGVEHRIFIRGKHIALYFSKMNMARTNRGKSPLRGMHGAILFYSCQNLRSFANLVHWVGEVRRFSEKMPITVVGTHYDEQPPIVEQARSRAFSQEHTVMMFETGKDLAQNVHMSFRMVIEGILGARPEVTPLTNGVLYYPLS